MENKIQPYDQSRIRLICNHEAGHYIVGRELEFKTHGIKILVQPNHGHFGEAIIEPWTAKITNFPKLINYLERRVQVLYAGAIAESMDENGDYNSLKALKEWESGASMNDHAKIRELVQALRNIKFPNTITQPEAQKELTQLDTELIEKAGSIVSKRLELIFGVGDLLFQKVKYYDTNYELPEKEINEIRNIRKFYIDSSDSKTV